MRKNPVFQKEIIRTQLETICEKFEIMSDLIHKDSIFSKIVTLYETDLEVVKKLNKQIESTLSMLDFISPLLLHGGLKSLTKKNLLTSPLDNPKLTRQKPEKKILTQNFQLIIFFQDYFQSISEGYQ